MLSLSANIVDVTRSVSWSYYRFVIVNLHHFGIYLIFFSISVIITFMNGICINLDSIPTDIAIEDLYYA